MTTKWRIFLLGVFVSGFTDDWMYHRPPYMVFDAIICAVLLRRLYLDKEIMA